MLAYILPQMNRSDLRLIANDPARTGVAFHEPPDAELLTAVDEEIFQQRSGIGLSMSNCNGGYWNLGVLASLPSVTRISLSHAGAALPPDLAYLYRQQGLRELNIQISAMTDCRILEDLPKTLASLHVGETSRPKRNLDVVALFPALRELAITGPGPASPGIGAAYQLKWMRLNTLSMKDLGFLSQLQQLEELRISGGNLASLEGLACLAALRKLSLWQFPGLCDLEPLVSLTGLEVLQLGKLARVTHLPSFKRHERLSEISLHGLKGLSALDAVAEAPGLRRFRFENANHCDIQDFQPLLDHPVLEYLVVNRGSIKKDRELNEIIQAAGKKTVWCGQRVQEAATEAQSSF